MAGQNETVSRAFTNIVMIAAIIGGVVAIVRPIQQRQDSMAKSIEAHIGRDGHPIYHTAKLKDIVERMERIEARTLKEYKDLDIKMEATEQLRDERVKARFEKLEEWQRWMYRNHLITICAECGKKLE